MLSCRCRTITFSWIVLLQTEVLNVLEDENKMEVMYNGVMNVLARTYIYRVDSARFNNLVAKLILLTRQYI